MISYIKKKHAQYRRNAHRAATMRTIHAISDPKCRNEALAMVESSKII